MKNRRDFLRVSGLTAGATPFLNFFGFGESAAAGATIVPKSGTTTLAGVNQGALGVVRGLVGVRSFKLLSDDASTQAITNGFVCHPGMSVEILDICQKARGDSELLLAIRTGASPDGRDVSEKDAHSTLEAMEVQASKSMNSPTARELFLIFLREHNPNNLDISDKEINLGAACLEAGMSRGLFEEVIHYAQRREYSRRD